MKRFGLRLAAGLAVVSLGGAGVYQLQQDKTSEMDTEWPDLESVAEETGPAPVPAFGEYPAPPDLEPLPAVVRGNNANSTEGNYDSPQAFGAVQQVGYDAPPSQTTPPQPAGPGADYAGADYAGADYGDTPTTAPSGDSFAMPTLGAPAGPAASEPIPAPGDSNRGYSDSSAPEMDGSLLPPPGAVSEEASNAPAASSFDAPALPPSANPTPSFASDDSPAGPAMPPAFDTAAGSTIATSQGSGQFDSSTDNSRMTLRPAGVATEADPVDAAAANWGGSDAPPPAPNNAPALRDAPAERPAQPNAFAAPSSQPAANNELAVPAAPSAPSFNAAPTGEGAPSGYGNGLREVGNEGGFAAAPASDSGLPEPMSPIGSGVAQNAPTQPPAWNTETTQPAPAPELRTASAQPLRTAAAMSSAGGGNGVATAIQTVEAGEVLSQPGTRDLEGTQTPSLAVQKVAPSEVRVGRPAEFMVRVQNVGNVPALDVRVFDAVPEGTSLVETVPAATPVGNMLSWQLGDLRPGEERTVVLKLVPETEGEIGSVARVTFEAAASVRTISTQPKLELAQRVPPQVLIGQQLEIDIELANRGSGSARGVVLMSDVPDGLEHVSGRQIELPIGELAPGSQRREILRLRATQPGVIQNTIVLTDSDGVETRSTVDIEVVAPTVELALDGPSLRYLERQATYDLQVANLGTADASNIEIAAFLDKGLKFVSTEANCQYDPQRHAVFWSLAELPAGKDASVPLTVLPVQSGKQAVRLEASADLGLTAVNVKELTIDTLAELSFTLADDQDPIEIGSETIYEVRVRNTGTRDDSNVRLEIMLPHPSLELVTADPAARTDGQGLVVFEPLPSLPAKGEQVYRIRVRGNTADTHLIKARLQSDQSKRPVTKEESTTVYSDK